MEEIQILLNKYIENEEYISCLEKFYILFEKHNIPYSDRNIILKKIYDYNIKKYKLEKSKTNELKNMELLVKNSDEIDKVCFNEPIEVTKKKVETLNCDISSYLDKIKDSSLDDLICILPKRTDLNFDNILDMILVTLYKEKVEYINFIHNQQENEPDIQEMFAEELELLDAKMEIILDYKLNDQIVETPIIGIKNKIVFLKNSSNEPIIFQNLKGCEEYYESFLEILDSIIDGTFKNQRFFTNNNKLVNMLEVKNFKTRILFSRIKDNIYVVIASFVKKCDTDFRHRNFIINMSQTYQNQKEMILSLIENEEYMLQEEKYLQELKNMLSERVKVKKWN